MPGPVSTMEVHALNLNRLCWCRGHCSHPCCHLLPEAASISDQREHSPLKISPIFTQEDKQFQKVKTAGQGPQLVNISSYYKGKTSLCENKGKLDFLNSMTSVHLFQLRHLCPLCHAATCLLHGLILSNS